MNLLTFNVGLLRRFGGLLSPTDHVEERLRALPDALAGSGAHVVALQELYERAHWELLRARLRDVFPHSASAGCRSWPRIPPGLCVLSRFPIAARFVPFRDAPIDERLLAGKGVLVARLQSAAGRSLSVFNVHTTAGGVFALPENPRIERVRRRQILQLLALADAEEACCPIVIGDLNAGPNVSDANYREMERAGWVDAHAHRHPGSADVTWDPANPLNAHGPHRTCPPQRIDHVFLKASHLETGSVAIRASRMVFRDPCVPVRQRVRQRHVTLSDHFGVAIELELR